MQNYCPPPANFKLAGEVYSAHLSPRPPTFVDTNVKERGRRAAGIRYESIGQEWLLGRRPLSYVPAPWIRFDTPRSNGNWCQPDGLDLDVRRGVITVVEFKLQHTSDAWWQLRRLYEPVVRTMFGSGWGYSLLEVVKWFDRDTSFPEPFRFTQSFHSCRPGKFQVCVWDGRT